VIHSHNIISIINVRKVRSTYLDHQVPEHRYKIQSEQSKQFLTFSNYKVQNLFETETKMITSQLMISDSLIIIVSV